MNKQVLDQAEVLQTDMLVINQVLIEKLWASEVKPLLLSLTTSKAFDSISHVHLFDIMLELGFPEHIVALLQSLYIDQTAVIIWNGSTTETFTIGKGVRQGCILSPHLFSLHTESVLRDAEIQDLGYNIGGRNVAMHAMPTTQHLSHSHQWRCSNY